MKKVILMSGIAGSGKSYQAERFAMNIRNAGHACVILSSDQFFTKTGLYVFNPALIGEAHAECIRKYIHELTVESSVPHQNRTIIVDNTNLTAVELAPYVALASAYGVPYVELVTVHCPVSVAIERNLHGVPATVIAGMASRLEKRELPVFWNHISRTEVLKGVGPCPTCGHGGKE